MRWAEGGLGACKKNPANAGRFLVPIDQSSLTLSTTNPIDQSYRPPCSLNIINEIVGLHFSCDGSHYLHYMILLEQDMAIFG